MVQFESEPNAAPTSSAAEVNGPQQIPASLIPGQNVGRNQERGKFPAVFGLLTAVFLASALLPLPTSDGQIAHIPAFCPFYRLTGLPCPGCGLTRAFVCISHGQFAQSLHWHPIGWLVYAVFALLWVREGLTLSLGRQVLPLSLSVQSRLGVASFAVVFLVGIARIGWLLAHHAHFV